MDAAKTVAEIEVIWPVPLAKCGHERSWCDLKPGAAAQYPELIDAVKDIFFTSIVAVIGVRNK